MIRACLQSASISTEALFPKSRKSKHVAIHLMKTKYWLKTGYHYAAKTRCRVVRKSFLVGSLLGTTSGNKGNSEQIGNKRDWGWWKT